MKNRFHSAPSRRDFLRWTAGGAMTASTFGALSSARALHAAAQGTPDYRALVIVYLAGGNDSHNLIVPTSATEYAEYLDSRQNLAVEQNELLSITPATSDGKTYGLHPSVPELQSLFASDDLAFIANVGNLVEPITRAQYDAKSKPVPPRLFSHNDQQQQSMQVAADAAVAVGWGGALSDRLAALNGVTSLSPSITLSGASPLLAGETTQQYHLGKNGSVSLSGLTGNIGEARRSTLDLLRGQSQSHVLHREYARMRNESIELDELLSGVLEAAPAITTPFPEEGRINEEMEMVARMIQSRSTLGMERQVFFVRMGGFDTHTSQLADQPVLFADLSATLGAFQSAMVEIGAANEVTVAVVSEFGRTLSSNGQGSDHGWGGHFMVMGGSVAGGDIYGTMPSLEIGGADDVSNKGRLIPTQSMEQVAATLARWMGIPAGQLSQIFPNLSNFGSSDLGFMA
ncbi:MAG: DUF1501 domain-containing protein [Planctomycetota bacterium]